MSASAAVVTGKGTGAISTIQLFGESAQDILLKIFKRMNDKPANFYPGTILLGAITDGNQTIDQITIGCEGFDCFTINCHGNPLIAEMIMQLLERHGAELVTAERLLAEILLSQKPPSTIHVEAKLSLPKAKTIQGAKIIANQTEHGLYQKVIHWQQNIDSLSLDRIASQASEIINNTNPAKLIIAGCTVVLAGPPNTGKSTLLNALAGRQKAIITNIAGTTRDWVSAQIQIEPLAVTLIDTAGLDGNFSTNLYTAADRAAQEKTRQLMQKADMTLLVLDNSQSADQLDDSLLKAISNKKVVTVLNKVDLLARFDTAKLPQNLTDTVQVSAKLGIGLDKLTEKICRVCGVADFDPKTTVCFTDRQENLLRQLATVKSKQQAAPIISELLNGQL